MTQPKCIHCDADLDVKRAKRGKVVVVGSKYVANGWRVSCRCGILNTVHPSPGAPLVEAGSND